MAKFASNCLQAWVARRLGPRAFVHLKDQGKEPRHVTGGQLEEFDFQEWNSWSPPPKCDNSRTEILKRCAAPLKTERSCSFGCQVRLVVLFFWLRLLLIVVISFWRRRSCTPVSCIHMSKSNFSWAHIFICWLFSWHDLHLSLEQEKAFLLDG